MNRPRTRLAPFAALPALLALAAPGCTPREDPAARPAPPPIVAPAPPPPAQPVLPPETPPLGRLPPGVRPLHYHLVLEIVPSRERFAGAVEIRVELDRPRSVVWMHGRDLAARGASVRADAQAPVPARFEQADATGVAALRLDRPVGPGQATIRIDWDAPFGQRLKGLYTVRRGAEAYAFSQLEATSAREVFPSFDEPSFKTPYDVTLFVPKGDAAIANAREVERVPAPNGLERVTYATTAPLPSYLLAFAVGPLDVVSAPAVPPNAVRRRPLPLRGVAARGRGRDLAYALEHTGAIVSALEGYFGHEYPFDKLDVLAVPDRQGAMENAGAVTFSEYLLLVDRTNAPADQRRAFASVTAHELAHMWFGDLVTMPWWDDLWLKEASATWMAARTADRVFPGQGFEAAALARAHGAMRTDELVSARQVRQEIRDHHDVSNAYDGITYQKGRGLLAMFERWIGPATFQQGVQQFMTAHRFGTATADDLLGALSRAAQRDVAGPFRSFLEQPGVPLVEARLACDGKPTLKLGQSRSFPLGSAGDPSRTWQIPVCVRYPAGAEKGKAKAAEGAGVRESCTLLSAKEGVLALETPSCPDWVMPNADGAGYYRWSLPGADLKRLAEAGYASLRVTERMSLAESVLSGFDRGTTPAGDALAVLAPLARDAHPEVAAAPMQLLKIARRWLEDDPLRPAVEAHGRALYAAAYRDLGASPAAAEPALRQLLRRNVVDFLALTAQDPAVRKELAARGLAYVGAGGAGGELVIHPEAVDPNLAGTALAVAVQDGDATLFHSLIKLFERTEDAVVRGRILHALGSVRAPDLAARARQLALDPRLRVSEVMTPVHPQLGQPETREAAWFWLKENLDALVARLPPSSAGSLPWVATSFCDRTHADEASQLFSPRIHALEGGPRNLAGALEAVHLCAARRKAHEAGVRAFFAAAKKP